MPTKKGPDEPILRVNSPAEWNTWLAKHHSSSPGVLLRLTKKGITPAIVYADALEVGLIWGWIDSQKLPLDEEAWLQRFTRRKPTSPWSKINRSKAEGLIAAGKMKPAGLAEVERAKADGRWERAYDGAKNAKLPEDLEAALAKNKKAAAFFAELNSTNRYAILYRVQTAKKAETRAERITRFVQMCSRGETLYPQTKKKAKPAKK